MSVKQRWRYIHQHRRRESQKLVRKQKWEIVRQRVRNHRFLGSLIHRHKQSGFTNNYKYFYEKLTDW